MAATNSARLAGKVALITGAGAGIGAATSRLFCREGARVALVDADAEALARTHATLREEFPDASMLTLAADVRDEAAATEVVARCVRHWGGLHVLVNNAAMRNYSAVDALTAEQWQAVVAVNLVGMSQYCKAALPALRASGCGAVVNVSSCYAVTGRKGMALYDATKAAQLAFTRTLAFEEAPNGVRANAICPGSTLTDFHVQRATTAGKSVEQLRAERSTSSLIGRWADPVEIAHPILWLASEEASFITGTTLMVDGGLHIM
ncbi:SDR family NAD(P)-dependent oxidoreductase [Pseudacidovorax sp. RU35E]|uniref:SDR family NAD(P)-dependent oxidoreductase n=1 Tax=Pseudacidovorax sp. RU35E TaxID=1907403 RepID=UPI000954DBFD|nr:SDR family NAD(P)-dependent oxidoreductase [Pseudacidovorax sp. RU35E]SIR40572.1 meso-butanediol dehydrogenase / (S,S)-butanediol dehydrogenase / diacetyl reductase [Pseudacidovorax sp. RU35E]